MSAHPALNTMLRGAVAALEARQAMPTTVEYESDPRQPGRTAIRITGPSSGAVQAQITYCMNAAENMRNSAATFTAPVRAIEGWMALGEVIVTETEA